MVTLASSPGSSRGRALSLLVVSVLAAGLGWSALFSSKDAAPGRHERDEPRVQAARFSCPMHPSYHADQPGDCPLCNMELVSVARDDAPQAPAVDGHAGV